MGDEYRTHLSLAFDISPTQADYFEKLSESLTLAREDGQDVASNFAEGKDIDYSNPSEVGRVLVGVGEDPGVVIEVAPDRKSVWISDHLDGNASVAGTAELIQGGLVAGKDPGIVGFEYASTCTEPRLDGFGGGAAAVSAEQVKIMSTFGLVDRLVTEIKNDRFASGGPLANLPSEEKTFSSSVPYEEPDESDAEGVEEFEDIEEVEDDE